MSSHTIHDYRLEKLKDIIKVEMDLQIHRLPGSREGFLAEDERLHEQTGPTDRKDTSCNEKLLIDRT